MVRATGVLLLLLTLPACVAAIGNRGGTFGERPSAVLPLMRERVESARHIVELRKRKVDDLRALFQAGRTDADAVGEAEIALEEANIRLLEYRAEVQAMESRKHDDD